jgi:hypothetical protein
MVRPERQALPLRKLDEVWNIATTREALERQNSLFDTDWVIVVVELNARQPQHARARPTQVQLCPFV